MCEPTVTINKHNTTWHVNGIFHREDGPAIDDGDGSKEWWVNGRRHREDGPAVESSNGTKSWWINGKCHREDGPAVVNSNNNYAAWYLNNEYLTQTEFNKAIKQLLGKEIKIIK